MTVHIAPRYRAAALIAALPSQRLRRLAVSWIAQEPGAQAERQGAIRALRDSRGRGLAGLSLTAARESVERAADAARAVRQQRMRNRAARSAGGIARADGRTAVRLQHRRARELQDSLHSTMRSYARESAPDIGWVDTLSDCTLTLAAKRGWIEYGRRQPPRYGITDARYTVRAMARIGVPRALHGLLTLGTAHAPAQETDARETVYRAVWARQAQGGPDVERGWIVCAAGPHGRREYAHGTTLAAARNVLSRRLGTSQRLDADDWERLRRWETAVRASLVAGRVDGYECLVRLDDARRAGLCDPGIRGWAARHFPGRRPEDGATVSEILAVGNDQRDYALAACLAAIRRQHTQGGGGNA